MLSIVLSLLITCDRSLGAPSATPPGSDHRLESAPVDELHFNTNYRSTPQIIWTCIITTFLCTWVSMYPNVVGYNSTWSQRFNQRFMMFLVSFATPEFVLLKAVGERVEASYITDRMNTDRQGLMWRIVGRVKNVLAAILWDSLAKRLGLEREKDGQWETLHGHFLLMGGVIFRVDGKLQYLEFDKLLDKEVGTAKLYITAREELKSLPSRNLEIRDRSKGDIVTKGITFIQTTWFIIHLGVRKLQNLEVTALEILTLAYAVASLFICICWWEKPFNVYNPIVVDLDLEEITTSSHRKGLVSAQWKNEYVEYSDEIANGVDAGNVGPIVWSTFLVVLGLGDDPMESLLFTFTLVGTCRNNPLDSGARSGQFEVSL